MTDVGRNDPCPCGSGKKYKRCCLAAEEEEERRERVVGSSLGQAIDWLFEAHGPAVEAAIAEDFFGVMDGDEVRDLVAGLSAGLNDMLEINANEWLLADAEIDVAGTRRRTADLMLAAGGPPLGAEARARLAELARRPLELYAVVESRPGEGVWLRDALDPAAPRLWVRERTASRALVPADVLGARLIPRGADAWMLSGALYPLPGVDLDLFRVGVLAELRGGDEEPEAEGLCRVVSRSVIAAWLESLAETTFPEPAEIDAGGFAPVVNDRYEVADWERLSAALAGEHGVDGSREDGWVRWETSGEEAHVLFALDPVPPDGLDAFASTADLADEGRTWLLRVAGDAVRFVTRRSVGLESDPESDPEGDPDGDPGGPADVDE